MNIKMKRSKVQMMTAMFAVMLMLFLATSFQSKAAGASLPFSKGTLRAGDSFSVTLNVNLSGALTVNGSFSYSGPVRLSSITGNAGSLDVNGNNIFVDLGNNAISGTRAIATANFTVSGSASAGETISVSFSGNYSNLNGDYGVSGSNGTTVAAPLSTNCNLQSLGVGNATLSPVFSAGRISYSAGTVPFSVSSLTINATPEDGKSKVSISGNSLAVGNNTVKVTVKAESGATKTYTIDVVREQDPNYVPSSDTTLSNIWIDGFLISPPFQNGVEEYVVWLPYETTAITAGATPVDAKASVSVVGGTDLVEGDNTIIINCTAEDGTKKEYYIIAKRATQDGSVIESEKPKEEEKPEEPQKENKEGFGLSIVICVGVVGFFLGATGLFILYWLGILPIMIRKKK